MNKKKILLSFLLSVFMLSGCWDANEPERMLYIQGVGVDHKQGKYIIYIQFANPSLVAKTESASTGTETELVVGQASGETINEAMFNLYGSSQRRLFWGHLSFIVLTESALKKGGLKATVDQFDRYRETRYNTYFYATKESLSELLTAVPPLGLSPYFSRLSDPKASFEQRSIVQPVDLRELLIALNEPPHEATIPYIRLNKQTWESNAEKQGAIQIAGGALLTRDDVKKFVPYKNIKGLTWLNKDFQREELTLKNGLSDVSLIVDKIKVKKKLMNEGEHVGFELSLKVVATLSEIVHEEKLSKIEKSAEKLLQSEIRKTYLEGIKNDTDVYRLSEDVYRRQVDTWKASEQSGKIPLKEDSLQKITVNVTVMHGEKQRRKPTL